ncbi:MAG: hypothetical protein PHZ02_11760 [Desulfocapsaceae bacterium]|nr:hypothetical protein [Desulfocapsaceae bacterium]
MKKILCTVAALGMVAGLAASASALELKIKGDYTVDGFYFDKGMGAAAYNGYGGQGVQLATNPGAADTNSDAWMQHMFNIEAEMIVNDKVSMKSRVRLIDWGTVWGAQDDTDVNNGRNMSIERLWLVYKSPIGTWEIGRRSAGAWGLPFVDSANAGDRIFWSSANLFGEQFSMYAFVQKLWEGEAYVQSSGDFAMVSDDDLDSDYLEVAATLKGGWGKATLGYGYSKNNTAIQDTISIDTNTGATIFAYGYQTASHRVKGVGQFKIGDNMGFDTEFDYKFGSKDYGTYLQQDMDISQFAFIADFNATVNDLTGHAMYFHTSGDDNAQDTDLESYGGTGADFEPLYILTGVFGNILNNDQGSTNEWGAKAKTAGVNAVVLTADFAASQDLTLHAAFGYAMADKELPGYDDDYGFEYNVGAAYRLLDNLIYAVHLGYLDTGDFFKLGTKYQDTEPIFLASHHLTMSF